VTSSDNPSTIGQSVTFTATVAAASPGAGTPTGSVTFQDSGVAFGTGTLNGSDVATYTTSYNAAALHAISAVYSGDTNFLTGAGNLRQTVGTVATLGVPDAWGVNTQGSTGNGTTTSPVANPAQFGSLVGATQVAGGGDSTSHAFTVALDAGGHVWTSGYNTYGQLGNNTTTNRSSPVEVCAVSGCGSFLSNITAIAAGDLHTLGLDSSGHVWDWGYNLNGELGNNSTVQKNIPVQVCATSTVTGVCTTVLSNITAIAAGDRASYALDSSGHVWAWGIGSGGQMGNNTTTTNNLLPIEVCATSTVAGTCTTVLSNITAIAAGNAFAVALDSSNHVWTWGVGTSGQLGNNTTSATQSLPVEVCATSTVAGTCTTVLSNITAISTQEFGATLLALDSGGHVWTWGYGTAGQLGNNTTTAAQKLPVEVCGVGQTSCTSNPLSNITAIAGGYRHSLALDANGNLYAWGDNTYKELGDGTTTQRNTPVAVTSQPYNVLSISAGFNDSYLLSQATGTINTTTTVTSSANPSVYGQTVTYTATVAPVSPNVGTPTATVTFTDGGSNISGCVNLTLVGGVATCSQTYTSFTSNTIAASYSGDSTYNSSTSTNLTQNVNQGTVNVALTTTRNPALAGQSVTFTATVSVQLPAVGTPTGTLTFADGGVNISGCVNLAMSSLSATCSETSSTPGYRSIVATYSGDTNFLTGNGSIFEVVANSGMRAAGWGYNNLGQLGDGSTTNRSSAVQFGSNLPSITQISSGGLAATLMTLVLDADGHVWATGNGQLGNNTTADSSSPVEVCAASGCGSYLSNIIQVVEGSDYKNSYALDSFGHVWAWGSNDSGQMGNGLLNGAHLLPSEVCAAAGCGSGYLSNIVQIASEGLLTTALDSSGHVWGWTYDPGNGAVQTLLPVEACVSTGCGNGFLSNITAISALTALDSSGHVWNWAGLEADGVGGPNLLPVEDCAPAGCGSGYLSNIVSVATMAQGGPPRLPSTRLGMSGRGEVLRMERSAITPQSAR
jgi:alpha-tubulin suppressor-like RCC1 family protein